MRAGSPATKEATEGDPLRPVERKRREERGRESLLKISR